MSLEALSTIIGRVMPPGYDLRIKLDEVISQWNAVAGETLGRQSALLDIMNGEVLVVAETPLVANRLHMMKGNILRILMERWQIEARDVKVTVGRLPLKYAPYRAAPRRAPAVPLPKEEEVRALAQEYLKQSPELTDEIASSLASLRISFKNRFGK